MKSCRHFLKYPYFLICFWFAFTITADAAYIDPSVMTYAIQALAGAAIGIGTFFSLYSGRIKKTLFGDLEFEKKTMESDALEFQDPSRQEIRKIDLSGKQTDGKKKRGQSFLSGFLLSLGLSFLLCFFTPLNLYFTNIREFRFDLYAFGHWILLLFLVVFALILGGYYLLFRLNKKLYAIALVLGITAFAAFYIQSSFLNGTLPKEDGSAIDWSVYKTETIQSLILWLVSFGVAAYLAWKKRSTFHVYIRVFSSLVITALSVSLLVTAIGNNGFAKKLIISVTNENMTVMSRDQNFVILVLDAVDAHAFTEQLNGSDPEYAEYFEDFTYYPDSLAAYPYTMTAIPQIITGEWYECQTDYRSYFIDAIKNSEFLNLLREKNYVGGMYDSTDFIYDDPVMYQYENIREIPYGINTPKSFLMNEISVIFYLNAPYPLKRHRENAIYNLQNADPGNPLYYTWYDDEFYHYCREHPVTLREEKTFRYIHLEGSHPKYRLDKNLNDIRNTGSPDYNSSLEGAMTAVHYYLEDLKKAGAYDNSVILVMADHGFPDGNENNARHNPMFLVKGTDEHHPFSVSDKAMSYAYLPDIYKALLDGKTGEDIYPFETYESIRRRYLWHDYNKPEYIVEYELNGKTAEEKDGLTETGKTYSLASQ